MTGVFDDVRKELVVYELCQNFRHYKCSRELGTWVDEGPYDIIAMNLIGPLHVSKQGSRYVLAITCLFTSFPEAVPLQGAGTQKVW